MSKESKKRPATGSLADYFSKVTAPSSSAAAAAAAASGKQHASPMKKPSAAAAAAAASPAASARKKQKREVIEETDDPFALEDDEEEDAPAPAPVPAPKATPKKAAASSSSTTSISSIKKPISAPAPVPAAAAATASSSRMHVISDDDEVDMTDVPLHARIAAATTAAPSSKKKPTAAAAAAPVASSVATARSTAAIASPPSKSATAAAAKAAAASAAAAAAAAEEKKRARDEKKDREWELIEAEQEQEQEALEQERKTKKPGAAAASSSRKAKAPAKKTASQKKNDGSDLAKRVSKDPAVVLAGVTRLKEEMAAEAAKGKKKLKLADLNLPNVKTDVQSMSEDAVRVQIERAAIRCIDSIMSGDGFRYDVPVRTGANQLYVAVLDRIVLKDKTTAREFTSIRNGRKTAITTRILGLIYELCLKKIHVTKRDLFYTDVKLFTKQADSDEVIEDIAAMIGSTRSSLNVVASEKGVVVGQISFKDDGDFIDCTRMGVGGKAIPPSIDRVTDIQGMAKFVLLVEKDAAFMRLAEDRFYNKWPCLIITAKGQPDVATRLFLKKVKETLKIPVLGLVDSDPYGLKILSVYMSGSKNMSYDSASLTTPDIKWLGVRPSDLDRYNLPDQVRLPMTDYDIKTGKELMQEEFIQKNPAWMAELELMLKTKVKAEIQALSSFGFRYLSEVYLPLKLQEEDWI